MPGTLPVNCAHTSHGFFRGKNAASGCSREIISPLEVRRRRKDSTFKPTTINGTPLTAHARTGCTSYHLVSRPYLVSRIHTVHITSRERACETLGRALPPGTVRERRAQVPSDGANFGTKTTEVGTANWVLYMQLQSRSPRSEESRVGRQRRDGERQLSRWGCTCAARWCGSCTACSCA